MGDYESALLAVEKMIDLGGNDQLLMTLNYILGKISPPELIDDVEQSLRNKYIQRDYSSIISMIDEAEISTYVKYHFKAQSYFLLEELDSARHYAQMYTENYTYTNYLYRPIETMYAILGNKEKSMQLVKMKIEKNKRIGDYQLLCEHYVLQIRLLCLHGDFQEATEKLVDLNKKYPQFGNYAALYNLPDYDKIKKEYPPFLEALNNLKLPMKLKIDELELL